MTTAKKTYYINEFNVSPSAAECRADALEKVINSLPDDCELVITRGKWMCKRRMFVRNKKNFVLRGEGATLLSHFCNSDLKGLDGAVGFEDCENITFKNFTFDCDVSPNMAGRVAAIDRENGTFDLKIFDSFKVNGNERFEAFNTVDEEYTPEYKMVTYGDCRKEYLGNNTFRIMAKDSGINIDRLHDGHLINIRHVKYGPALITFKGVYGCTVEDITIHASAGLTFLVEPRCSDFSFICCRLILPENTDRIFTANADGMHIVGLTGKLYIKDCYFENLGDDALNMHSTAGTVADTDCENNAFDCVYGRINDGHEHLLDKDWAKPGDVLNIYEKESFEHVASVKVLSYDGKRVEYEPIFGKFQKGNIVGNTAYYAETHLDGFNVYNTRARAFLFQTENILVENCHIYGMSGCAMILSPDIRVWHEVGPCKNVVIRNNLIEKCGYSKSPSNIGSIAIKCCHDAGLTDSPAGVHENITIENNVFKNIGDSAIFALAVDGLKVINNRYENCSCNRFSEEIDSLKYDVAIKNCNNVTLSGNSSDRDEAFALYLDNVTDMK